MSKTDRESVEQERGARKSKINGVAVIRKLMSPYTLHTHLSFTGYHSTFEPHVRHKRLRTLKSMTPRKSTHGCVLCPPQSSPLTAPTPSQKARNKKPSQLPGRIFTRLRGQALLSNSKPMMDENDIGHTNVDEGRRKPLHEQPVSAG